MNPWAIRWVWLLSVTLVLAAGRSVFWDTNVEVIIYNDLEDKKDLTIHCKSKDDDLGVRVLSYKEYYDFQFKPHLFGRTLFFCRVTWNGKSHWFDVYRGDRDNGCYESDICVWNVRQNGPCTEILDVCYPWDT
ncbi:hypothetical protein F3Y22_tig00110711pilonHSYRG00007 [Hibiscus syriacus]|uniref:S-protein homolog n=1 Tax=Hibiscus syriacus TaxID=106335 RepID=A0A6A2ZVI6_HIBSY|nr:S-protein homolog 2-like [Hibiscus syriacus]KAE8695437.1 hypothetical protein F3Y22_tig00110711pilonHSYRG00007 [Hibiscus syriacus]